MRDLLDLERLIDGGAPLILVETADTVRLEELCRRMATRSARPVHRWSMASGMARLDDVGVAPQPAPKSADALARILAAPTPGLYLLLDLARDIAEPLIVSQLREIATRHGRVPHTLVVPGGAIEVPADLRGATARLDLEAPTVEELERMVHAEAEAWGSSRGRRVQATQAAIAALVRNLSGLSHAEARGLVRGAIADDGVLGEADLAQVMTAKHRLLDQGGVLSFELDTAKLADVAGLDNLKRWLGERKSVFLAAAPPPGLDPPKGLLLLGVQGGGKSLAAKAVAGAWGVPLLRLDFASLYNKYYGETERNLRESLRTAGSMAPCVLWIDEIEKGLASEGDDGGPGKRILGTLLTWMAERKDRVFMVATANDIESLPPELLRKGRFDEIFFVDLPAPAVRREVFAIHLRKRGQDPARFELPVLATAAEGFSGAEIEQGVVAALYAAHARNAALDTEQLLSALAGTKPLSVVMAERVAHLRAWAADRTVPAG